MVCQRVPHAVQHMAAFRMDKLVHPPQVLWVENGELSDTVESSSVMGDAMLFTL